jgi:hypothetical protein
MFVQLCLFKINMACVCLFPCRNKAKFDSLGLEVDAENILCSSFAAVTYLEQLDFKKSGKKVTSEIYLDAKIDNSPLPLCSPTCVYVYCL